MTSFAVDITRLHPLLCHFFRMQIDRREGGREGGRAALSRSKRVYTSSCLSVPVCCILKFTRYIHYLNKMHQDAISIDQYL